MSVEYVALPSYDTVVAIYARTVSAGELISEQKLRAACAAPSSGFGGTEFYPGIHSKAVKLADGISRAQAFQDGNKRLALIALVVTLRANGWDLDVGQEEVALWIREDISTRDDAATARSVAWLEERTKKKNRQEPVHKL